MDNYFENYLVFHLPITKRAAVYCLISRLWIVTFLFMERCVFFFFLIIEEPGIVIKHVFCFSLLPLIWIVHSFYYFPKLGIFYGICIQ